MAEQMEQGTDALPGAASLTVPSPQEQRSGGKRHRSDDIDNPEPSLNPQPKKNTFKEVSHILGNLTSSIGRSRRTEEPEIITGDLQDTTTNEHGSDKQIEVMQAPLEIKQATNFQQVNESIGNINKQFEYVTHLYNSMANNLPDIQKETDEAKNAILTAIQLIQSMAAEMQTVQNTTVANQEQLAKIKEEIKEEYAKDMNKFRQEIDTKIQSYKDDDQRSLRSTIENNTNGDTQIREQLQSLKYDADRKNDEEVRSYVYVAKLNNPQNKNANQILDEFFQMAGITTFFQNKVQDIRIIDINNRQAKALKIKTPNPWTAQMITRAAGKKLSLSARENRPLPGTMDGVSVYQGSPAHTHGPTAELVNFAKEQKARNIISHFITKYDIGARQQYLTVFKSLSLADRAHFAVTAEEGITCITTQIEGESARIDQQGFYIATQEENNARGEQFRREEPRQIGQLQPLNIQPQGPQSNAQATTTRPNNRRFTPQGNNTGYNGFNQRGRGANARAAPRRNRGGQRSTMHNYQGRNYGEQQQPPQQQDQQTGPAPQYPPQQAGGGFQQQPPPQNPFPQQGNSNYDM